VILPSPVVVLASNKCLKQNKALFSIFFWTCICRTHCSQSSVQNDETAYCRFHRLMEKLSLSWKSDPCIHFSWSHCCELENSLRLLVMTKVYFNYNSCTCTHVHTSCLRHGTFLISFLQSLLTLLKTV
jgi:hypothetical protein